MLKRIISFLFDQTMPELLLGFWAWLWLPLIKWIKHPGFGAFILSVGVQLHKVYNSYWTFWLCHYLHRDTRWDATQAKMSANPLCPDGLRTFYRDLLFEAEPQEVKETFEVLPWSNRVTHLYRARQERCGFKSLV